MGTHPDLIKALVNDRQAQLVRTAQRPHQARRTRPVRPPKPARRRNPVARLVGGLLISLGRRLAPDLRA